MMRAQELPNRTVQLMCAALGTRTSLCARTPPSGGADPGCCGPMHTWCPGAAREQGGWYGWFDEPGSCSSSDSVHRLIFLRSLLIALPRACRSG